MKSIILSIGTPAGFYMDGYNISFSKENLKQSDILLAEDFIKGLGMGDTESELKRCQTYKELFEREYKDAQQQTREKGALYGKLGIFIGLLFGIVLI